MLQKLNPPLNTSPVQRLCLSPAVQGEVLVAAPGQAAAAVLAQAQVAHGEDHVTVELDPAIYDSLVPCDQPDEQQTTHVQIGESRVARACCVFRCGG